MEVTTARRPIARRARLLVEEVGDETIVYDQDRKQAHSLNRAAALVWRNCDGTRDVAQLTAILNQALDLVGDDTLTSYTLAQLQQANLLEGLTAPPRTTRRSTIKRMAVAGAALAIPTVLSIAAPTPAMAASVPLPPPDPGEDQ